MIEYKDVYLQYGNKKIFSGFSLFIKEREKILLNSASGKGKTTLIKLLLGYVKAQKGEIKFKGEIINKKNIALVRSSISYVSQDVELFNENVKDLIKNIFNYKYNKNKELDLERLNYLIEFFEMPLDLLEKRTEKLSGGERQRLGLIIADLLNRDVWLLDEVTSGLDKSLKEKVVRFVSEINKTVIIISHDNIWQKYKQFKIISW